MDPGETSALSEAIELAMRIIRCADEIVRARPDITRRELIERLSEIFLEDAVVAHGAEPWGRR